ncbi:MAG: RICIN domain-containing protein [Gemmobacter sp.]
MRLPLALLLLSLCAPALAQEIRTDIYYRLHTEYLGPDMPLGVVNGGDLNNAAMLEPLAESSAQYWHIVPSARGTIRLTTMFRGQGECLGVILEGARTGEAALLPCNEEAGQRWTLDTREARLRLSNDAAGATKCLDVIGNGAGKNRLYLNDCGFWAGQLWTLKPTLQPLQ